MKKLSRRKKINILAYVLLSPLIAVVLTMIAILCFLAYKGGTIVWIGIAVIASAIGGVIILIRNYY